MQFKALSQAVCDSDAGAGCCNWLMIIYRDQPVAEGTSAMSRMIDVNAGLLEHGHSRRCMGSKECQSSSKPGRPAEAAKGLSATPCMTQACCLPLAPAKMQRHLQHQKALHHRASGDGRLLSATSDVSCDSPLCAACAYAEEAYGAFLCTSTSCSNIADNMFDKIHVQGQSSYFAAFCAVNQGPMAGLQISWVYCSLQALYLSFFRKDSGLVMVKD